MAVRTEAQILHKIATMAKAVLTGKKVPLEVFNARVAICDECEHGEGPKGARECGLCGCKIAGIDAPLIKNITALASYEEDLPDYGCKHPYRDKGSGWPKVVEIKVVDSVGTTQGSNK